MNEIITAITPEAILRTIKRHQILLYQGEVPRYAYILKKGIMKAYSINANGNEQISAFYIANDMFPITWIFNKTSSAIYYYETVTDCEVLTVDKNYLQNTVHAKPELLKAAFEYLLRSYTSTQMRITGLEQSRANEKIMFTLYYLAFRYGKETTPSIFTVELGLTQGTIADMVGLTRETTAVELNKLKKQGVVTYASKSYRINKAKLERLMGEDSFSSAGL